MTYKNIQVENILAFDFPDFVDAYVSYAEKDGIPLTDEELDELNNKYPEIAQEYAYNKYIGAA